MGRCILRGNCIYGDYIARLQWERTTNVHFNLLRLLCSSSIAIPSCNSSSTSVRAPDTQYQLGVFTRPSVTISFRTRPFPRVLFSPGVVKCENGVPLERNDPLWTQSLPSNLMEWANLLCVPATYAWLKHSLRKWRGGRGLAERRWRRTNF